MSTEQAAKIFVRERQHAGKGTGRPRFAVVAVVGVDLKIYAPHLRKIELEKLAEEVKAQIVYLPRGEKVEGEEGQEGTGKGRRRRGWQANQGG